MRSFAFHEKLLLTLAIGLSMQSVASASSHNSDDQLVESPIPANATPYTTMDEAAVAALRIAVPQSQKFEFAGCLFTDQSKFYFTVPVHSGSEDSFKAACLAPGNFKLVGLFHTHPIGAEYGVSAPDIKLAKQLNVTSYVAFIEQNQAVKYIPGRSHTECYQDEEYCGADRLKSTGTIVASPLMP
jgi:hypothetical protein